MVMHQLSHAREEGSCDQISMYVYMHTVVDSLSNLMFCGLVDLFHIICIYFSSSLIEAI